MKKIENYHISNKKSINKGTIYLFPENKEKD